METNFSPIENYPFLSPFIFTENPEELEVHKEALLKQLEEVWRPLAIDSSQSMEYLTAREKVFAGVIEEYYREQYKKIVESSLCTNNSFGTLSKNTHLLDSIIHTAFEYGVADLQILKERIKEDLKKELLFKKRSLPKKKKKLSLSRTQIEKVESNPEDPDQRQMLKYYESIEAELIHEIENHSERLKELEELLPQVNKSEIKLNLLLNHLVVFARGGYGRAELSFASDRDLGYCLDTQQLSAGESEICRQFIVHIEHLLREAGIETAHQYFELNEDLSRFKDPSVCLLYTSPSPRD